MKYARQGAGGTHVSRVTIRDHPRAFMSPVQRSRQAQEMHLAFHDKAVSEGWTVGAFPEITWCDRHGLPTQIRVRKSYCDACEDEAAAFLATLRVPRLAAGLTQRVHSETRRGDVTGRKGGRRPPSGEFNRPLVVPRNRELQIFRDD